MKISGGKTTISRAEDVESSMNSGRLSSVVSSADCRSAQAVPIEDTRNTGVSANDEGAAGTTPLRSAEPRPPEWFSIYVHDGKPWPGNAPRTRLPRPLRDAVSLVQNLAGKIHKSDCHRVGRIYKGIAPEISEADAIELIQVRKLDACLSCFPELRSE